MSIIDPIPYKIAPEDQLCFLHIPKTAGTTFTYIIQHYFAPNEVCPTHFWHEIVNFSREDLATYKYLGGHIRYNIFELLPKKPHYIVFLRDPIDRVISHYDHTRRVPESPFHHSHSLEEFLADPVAQIAFSNTQTSFLGLNRSTFNVPPPSQYSFKQSKITQATLDTAKERLEEFLFIGLTEKFQESLYLLSHVLGWRPIQNNENRNVSPNRLQKKDLSPALLEQITELNQFDIELYNFGKALYEKHLQEACQGYSNIFDVAEGQYQQLFLEKNKPVDNLIFDFTHVLPGNGFHVAESSPENGVYRWTGPQTESIIDLPLTTNRDLDIEIKVLSGITEEIEKTFSLKVDDNIIPLTKYGEFYTGTLSHAILAKQTEGFVRLTLGVKETKSPEELGINNDSRRLGTALSSLSIKPHEQK